MNRLDKVLCLIMKRIKEEYMEALPSLMHRSLLFTVVANGWLDVNGVEVKHVFGGCGVPDYVIIRAGIVKVTIGSDGEITVGIDSTKIEDGEVSPGELASQVERIIRAAKAIREKVEERMRAREEEEKRRERFREQFAENLVLALKMRGIDVEA